MANPKSKKAFRRSEKWSNFRHKLIQERQRCQICGRTKGLTIHHYHESLALNDYTDLSDESNFFVICSACHKFLHAATTALKDKSIKEHHPALEEFIYKFVFHE